MISYGTTVVYAVRRWSKRRYAAHDCHTMQQKYYGQELVFWLKYMF